MNQYIRTEETGLYSIYFRSCRCDVLEFLLSGRDTFVFVQDYVPKSFVEWWPITLPINESGEGLQLEARRVGFDFHLATQAFLESLPLFSNAGINLVELSTPPASTLLLDDLSEERELSVLQKNGLVSRFDLPHANEVGKYSMVNERLLEQLIQKHHLHDLLLVHD